MRISTSSFYSKGVNLITEQQSRLIRSQEELSSGKNVLTPADDPIKSTNILQFSELQNRTDRYMTNANTIKSTLTIEESTLAQANLAVQNVKTLAIQARNDSLSADNRDNILKEMESNFNTLLSLANTKDQNNDLIFSGLKGGMQNVFTTGTISTGTYVPGQQNVFPDVTYSGTEGQRTALIGDNHTVKVGDSGQAVFNTPSGLNVFGTINEVATWLKSGQLSPNFDTAMGKLDQLSAHLTNVRASVGTRLQDIDNSIDLHTDANIQYEKSISELQDVDYAKAISDFYQQRSILDASQRSFAQAQNLSLFSKI